MQNGFPQLGGTFLIHAAMVSLALSTNDMSATNGTLLRHVKRFVSARMIFIVEHTCDFGDHVAAALDFDPVADLHSQSLDLVHVVKGRAAHGRAADRNGF